MIVMKKKNDISTQSVAAQWSFYIIRQVSMLTLFLLVLSFILALCQTNWKPNIVQALTTTGHGGKQTVFKMSYIPFVMQVKQRGLHLQEQAQSKNVNIMCLEDEDIHSHQDPSITVPVNITFYNDDPGDAKSLAQMIHTIGWSVESKEMVQSILKHSLQSSSSSPAVALRSAMDNVRAIKMRISLMRKKENESDNDESSFVMMGNIIHLYSLVKIESFAVFESITSSSSPQTVNPDDKLLWSSESHFACLISIDDQNSWLSIHTNYDHYHGSSDANIIDEALRKCPFVHQSPECNQNEMVLRLKAHDNKFIGL